MWKIEVLQLRLLTGSLYFTQTAETIVQTKWQKSIFCRTNAEQMQEESNWISTMTPTVCKANAGWTQRRILSNISYGVQSLKKWKKKKADSELVLWLLVFIDYLLKGPQSSLKQKKNLPQNRMSETVKIEQKKKRDIRDVMPTTSRPNTVEQWIHLRAKLQIYWDKRST